MVSRVFQCLDLKPELKTASMDFELASPRDRGMAAEILCREAILIQF